jgi:hypothetical protein
MGRGTIEQLLCRPAAVKSAFVGAGMSKARRLSEALRPNLRRLKAQVRSDSNRTLLLQICLQVKAYFIDRMGNQIARFFLVPGQKLFSMAGRNGSYRDWGSNEFCPGRAF